jgi:hypothetical protein
MSMKTTLLVAFAAFGVACSTPSVPLPPPEVDVSALSFATAGAGEVTLSAQARVGFGGDEFFIVNQRTGDGVISKAAADGSFTSPVLGANVGDSVEIFFLEPNGTESDTTCVTVLIEQSLEGNTCQ